MSCAGDNRFYFPSVEFPREKVWSYLQDVKYIISESLSARHFRVVPDIRAIWEEKFLEKDGLLMNVSKHNYCAFAKLKILQKTKTLVTLLFITDILFHNVCLIY